MIRFFIRLSFLWAAFTYSLCGQNPLFEIPDSLVIIDSISIADWENLDYQLIDDSTNAFESHRYRNGRKHKWSYIDLGNNGSESINSVFRVNIQNGLQLGYRGYELLRWEESDFKYFNANAALTKVNTALGTSFANSSTSLQDNAETNAFFTRNFKNKVNTTLKYRSISEQGMYTRDQSKHLQVLLNVNQWNKKNTFFYYLGWIRNAMNRQVNGGISELERLQDSLFIIRENIPVKYSNSGNRDASNLFSAGWKYYLSRGKRQFIIGNTTQYEHREFKYYLASYPNDSLDVFYNISPTVNGLRNYVKNERVSNKSTITWSSKFLKTIQAGYEYRYHWLTGTSDDVRQYGTLSGKIELDFKNTFLIKASSYIETLDEAGDFNLEGSVGLQLENIGKLEGNISLGRQLPDLDLQELFLSGETIYQNALNSYTYLTLGGQLDIPRWRINLSAQQSVLNNFAYLDRDFNFNTADDVLSITQLSATHEMKIWKFHLKNQVHFQILDETIFALPTLMTRHQLLFQGRVRKNGMIYRLGVEGEFNQMDNQIRYVPFTTRFIPSSNNVNNGWTYRVDPYAQFDIRGFSVFFKAENLQSIWWDEHFFLVNDRPFFDWMLRIGIEWKFIN